MAATRLVTFCRGAPICDGKDRNTKTFAVYPTKGFDPHGGVFDASLLTPEKMVRFAAKKIGSVCGVVCGCLPSAAVLAGVVCAEDARFPACAQELRGLWQSAPQLCCGGGRQRRLADGSRRVDSRACAADGRVSQLARNATGERRGHPCLESDWQHERRRVLRPLLGKGLGAQCRKILGARESVVFVQVLSWWWLTRQASTKAYAESMNARPPWKCPLTPRAKWPPRCTASLRVENSPA